MFSNKWFILAVIVIAVLVVWSLQRGGDIFEIPETAEQTGSPTSSPAPAGPGSDSVFTPGQIQTYTDLVRQFEGRRIQFSESCHGNPGSVTFKNGTQVMFDNRSSSPRTIAIGNQVYSFPAYGYRILTLSSANLPATISVNCDNNVNSSQILLQANILEQL